MTTFTKKSADRCRAPLRRPPQRSGPDESRNIENQCHPPIAENAGAGDAVDPAVIGFDRFDDGLLLTLQLVHEEADPFAIALDHDDESIRQRARARLDSKQVVETHDG